MTAVDEFMADPCEQFLQARFAADEPTALREQLRQQTVRIVRARRRWRRLGYAAALAVCYVAGVVTMRFLASVPQPELQVVVAPQPEPMTAEPQAPEPTLAGLPDDGAPALILERRGQQAPRSLQTLLFRRAGDRYLEQEGDVVAALRCYRRALDVAPVNELAIAAEDSWLLMALKNERSKENRNGRNDG
jgi:hypothetical protein